MNTKKISTIIFSIVGIFLTASSAMASVDATKITSDLTIGTVSSEVKILQQYLNEKGYTVASAGAGSSGNETTRFGNATAAALAKFQTANGISPANGYFGAKTRALIASLASGASSASTTTSTATSTAISDYISQINTLKALIAVLQTRLSSCNTTSTGDTTAPYIASINISNGGNSGYIDDGDTIVLTFSEPINPKSINANLKAGNTVSSIVYTVAGGVSISSSGLLNINGITTFDIGTVNNSGTFTSQISLSSSGTVLTITLVDGSSIGINSQSFTDAVQLSGTVADESGNSMTSMSITNPAGTFGGSLVSKGDFYVSSIKVTNGGSDGYIDVGDKIAVTFSEAIDPSSINSDLDVGSSITGISSSQIGGIKVTSAGKVTIYGIASFDMGSVDNSGTFTSKVALSSNGKVLTISLTDGNDIEITDESFTSAMQIGGTVENEDGNALVSDSSIDTPTGTFGGISSGSSSSSDFHISSIKANNGNKNGYIDVGDYLTITFNNAIDPKSINSELNDGSYIYGIGYSEVGGVQITSSGKVTINSIASFDMGSVDNSGTFVSKVALSSNGKVLTITLVSGSDIAISGENFGSATQVSDTVDDEDGETMGSDSGINTSGTFGGEI